jgi:ethanolamine ammonia-lyase large subunit
LWLKFSDSRRIPKKKGISNLTSEEIKNNGNTYLEKEFSLVQRIISDTKELKNINKLNNMSKSDLAMLSRQLMPNYKSQEEYYEEVMGLKKV